MNLVYQAIDSTGREVRDIAEAGSVREALELLRSRGLMVTHIEQATEQDIHQFQHDGYGEETTRLPLREVMVFTRQMAMLLTAGSAVVPALGAVRRQMKNSVHAAIIQRIRADVEEGIPLTDALRKFPRSFDAIYCALVAAGETSAKLPQMFARLAEMTSKRRATRNKIRGAMAYPVLLIALSISILGVMFFFVMPRFGQMFETLRVPLPTSTSFMLSAAGTISHYWYLFAALGIATPVILVAAIRSRAGRRWFSNVQLRIPVIGSLLSRLILGRVLRVVGELIEANVGILESLDLVRNITSNERYQAMFEEMEQSVTQGKSLSGAMERSALAPPAICQAIQTGEETGSLGTAISFAADVLDEENGELIEAATKLVEPSILIAMGLVIGAVSVSLFLPLFDMTSAVR